MVHFTTLLPVALLGAIASATPVTETRATTTSPDDAARYLAAHNAVRAQHGAPALTWSSVIADNYSTSIAQRCKTGSSGGGLGENSLAAAPGTTIEQAIKSWASEPYDPANPKGNHFTQLVWKSTTIVGCASVDCPSGITGPDSRTGDATIFVCSYYVPGNVQGKFADNVQ